MPIAGSITSASGGLSYWPDFSSQKIRQILSISEISVDSSDPDQSGKRARDSLLSFLPKINMNPIRTKIICEVTIIKSYLSIVFK